MRAILQRVKEAMASVRDDLRAYMKEHADFEEVGARMLQEWEKGISGPQGSGAG